MAPKKAEAFLKSLALTGNIALSARSVGWDRKAAMAYRDQHPDFAVAWDDALEVAVDALEAEARRRGVEGTEEPVWYKGEVVGAVRKYSDTLLIFLIKGNRPEKFRDNYQQADPRDKTIATLLEMVREQSKGAAGLVQAAPGIDQTLELLADVPQERPQ